MTNLVLHSTDTFISCPALIYSSFQEIHKMKIFIKIYSAYNHAQFISIRKYTNMPTLTTLCITGKPDSHNSAKAN